jgi:hypothetical protein
MDKASRRPVFEARSRPGAAEDRRIGRRLRRNQALAEILLERGPEPFAERAFDESDLAPAMCAERFGLGGRGLAGQAGRRIDEIERGAPQRRERRAEATGPPSFGTKGFFCFDRWLHCGKLARGATLREGRAKR